MPYFRNFFKYPRIFKAALSCRSVWELLNFAHWATANDISGQVCINQRRLPTRLSYGKSIGVCSSSGGRRTEVIGVLKRGMVYPLNFSMRALRKSIWDTVV